MVNTQTKITKDFFDKYQNLLPRPKIQIYWNFFSKGLKSIIEMEMANAICSFERSNKSKKYQ